MSYKSIAHLQYRNEPWKRHLLTPRRVLISIVVVCSIVYLIPSLHTPHSLGIPTKPVEVSSSCDRSQKPTTRTNRRVSSTPSLVIKNAVIWDGEGGVFDNMDILIQDGLIKEIRQNITTQATTIDAAGHIVSPGLVDMHTHLGIMNWPSLRASKDLTEDTQPITPFSRIIDAFDPSDKAIPIVASGGVTTALVLPGSNNVIGGEGFVFKLREMKSNEDMLVQAHEQNRWRYMKMACGENPKNHYGHEGKMPSTRMGEAYLARQAFANARSLIQAQDDWCETAKTVSSHQYMDKHYPIDIDLDLLTSLLRGQVKLNIHCYEKQDMETMLRHSKEFGFQINSFHHAIEAYQIPELLKDANVTVAMFADHWGFKVEAYDASPYSPRILHEAGIPVALKSDHPVMNSQHLVFEAAKAAHYGLPPQEAFKAVTSVPAHALGLGDRIGALKVGYDADIVIWDRSPLDLGAAPVQVFIDGVPLFDQKLIENVVKTEKIKKESVLRPKSGTFKLVHIDQNLVHGSSSVIVKDGVVCADCVDTMEDIETVDLQGGYVLPGLIAVGSKLGLVEIPSEPSTGDGIVPASYPTDPNHIISAVDGLKLGTKKLKEAYKGGILTTISSPVSNNIIMGISVAFKTGAQSILQRDTLVSSAAALHIQIGDSAKSPSFPTISSQISFLRRLFTENSRLDNHYGHVAQGKLPLIVMVNNKDEIASLILLKKNVIPNATMAIMGGAEAHLLAKQLAESNIPVILRPHLCTPQQFDSQHCMTGAPLTDGLGAHILHAHGVKLGVGVSDDGSARNLAWYAGWLSVTSDHQITESDAIRFVTSHLQDIFGLTKAEDDHQEFVVWSGSPLDMESRVVMTYDPKQGVQWIE
ncbi:hypothetical protein BDB01DRAFT_750183 [Pilobolus umbonatus]|nr:hypothetical protein BDB01DRAFT_750183 [Pilobolus umbonatus]